MIDLEVGSHWSNKRPCERYGLAKWSGPLPAPPEPSEVGGTCMLWAHPPAGALRGPVSTTGWHSWGWVEYTEPWLGW